MNKKVSFVIIGESKISRNFPKNIFILGPISYKKIPAFMQYTDIGLILFKNLSRINDVEN